MLRPGSIRSEVLSKSYDMISENIIKSLYRQYPRRPKSIDELNFPLLFENAHVDHAIAIDGDTLVINSLSPSSPFHRIPVRGIHAIVDFDESVAIVLHSSILFISKVDGQVNVHINFSEPCLMSRIFGRDNR